MSPSILVKQEQSESEPEDQRGYRCDCFAGYKKAEEEKFQINLCS